MQAKDPSDNLLTTRQVSDLIEELVGRRPTSDQIREWCRQGYVAPEELPPIHLEHVRNRQGHYEITEESVRRFVEMRRRRETNLLAFVKWCRQRSAELQTKSDHETAATPPEPADASDDEPAPVSPEEPIATDTVFVGDLNASVSGREPPPPESETQPAPDFDPETTVEQISAQPIRAEAVDAFAGDLLSRLVVEETGEEIEDDFFSTFIEDDQCDFDLDEIESVDDDAEVAKESEDSGAATTISDLVDDSSEIKSPEPVLPHPELSETESSNFDLPPDDFGSFDDSPPDREERKRGRRGFRSFRARRSHQSPQHSKTKTPDPMEAKPGDTDEFSLGIFESRAETPEPECDVDALANDIISDDTATSFEPIPDADDRRDSASPIAEAKPAAEESPVIVVVAESQPIIQSEPVAKPIAAISETAPKPTPTHPVAPTLSLPPIKPLPPNSPLLPNFGAPRVSSPLRPEAQAQKPIAKQPPHQTAKSHPPRRMNAPAARRVNGKHSAQLDQLAAAYAAFASGAAPVVAEPSVEPISRAIGKSPSKLASRLEAPAAPAARRDVDRKTESIDRATDNHAKAAKTESRPVQAQELDRRRDTAQVSRYLWLWVAAIAIGWACFGVSFVIKDDFAVIALSSIAVAATGMSGLWWTGK